MAYTKEYQLWILVKASNNHRVIEGIKIIRARPGSVILDVLVKHTEKVLPEEAFEVFEKAMNTPASTTRVQNILQIKQGTTQVEFIPIVLDNDKNKGMCIVCFSTTFIFHIHDINHNLQQATKRNKKIYGKKRIGRSML